jgi:outer membrane protein TolC
MPLLARPRVIAPRITPLVAMVLLAGCASQQFDEVTIRTDDLVRNRNATLADGVRSAPQLETDRYPEGRPFPDGPETELTPDTRDPKAENLPFEARDQARNEAEAIIDRIRQLAQAPADAEPLTLDAAIEFAATHAVEYTGAEQTYLLAALSVVTAQRLFEPRFFNDTSFTAGEGLDPRYDAAMRAVNDFGVRQRLPYGGEVTARFIAEMTRSLDGATSGDGVESATFVLDGRLPLLQGAGAVAREPLVQAQRDLVYASRSFETFRRDFLVSIVTDYLDLVLQLNAIANAERGVELNRQVEDRESALVAAGRQEPFQADLARQATLFALDDLAAQQESYRLSVDRFKVRIGMNAERPIVIVPTELQLPIPDATQDQAVRYALDYRLDLQTARDQLEDSRRRIDLAENGLLPALDLVANVRTNDPQLADGVNFDLSEAVYTAGVNLSLPLDRVDESVALRGAQVRFAQAERQYQRTLDDAAVGVRRALREIDRARFSLLLQERNVDIARNRLASIDAAPDRATARDRTEAVSGLRNAQDSRARSSRNLQVAILNYLNAAGLLRVAPEGRLQPLPGMVVGEVLGG